MGDSWEDEDFEQRLPPVPVASLGGSAPTHWDEEDEVELDNKLKAVKLTPEMIAANEKKARDAEAAFENKLKLAELAKETPEERKARERKAMEDSDAALAGELFDSKDANSPMSGTSRAGSVVVLKTKQDHSAYGTTVAQKLGASSAFNVAAFYKTLSKVCEGSEMTSQVLAEIIGDLTKIRDNKQKLEKPAPVSTAVKKSKKQINQEQKKHADIWGGASEGDFDRYADIEDSFM